MDRSGLDPQVLAYLQQQEALEASPLNTRRAAEVREEFDRDFFEFLSPPEAVKKVEEFTVPGYREQIALRVYTPEAAEPLPILLYIHGGGWVLLNLDTHDSLCRQIANLAACMVVSVNYHLAPESKFPYPLEDCWAAVCWVRDNIAGLGGDPQRIAVGGDSAGGNLSAALTLLARERDPGRIGYQLLIYPVTDVSNFERESYKTLGQDFGLTREDMIWFAEQYTSSEAERNNPLVSPLLADNLEGLPPAHVVTAGFDPLRDEGQEYTLRLKQAGVPVTEICYRDQIHGLFCLDGVIDQARAAIEEISVRLREALRI